MEKFQKKNTAKDCFLRDKILYVALAILFLVDLFFVYSGNTNERFFTKTLLVPMMVFIYLKERQSTETAVSKSLNKLFLAGLLFSFMGDVFLLFNCGFLPGLGFFLAAHVCYIFSLKAIGKGGINYKYLIFIAVYYFILIISLYQYLNEMKTPVMIYGLVISTMLYFSLKTKEKLLIAGALLFVISDSLLSVNLFVKETLFLSITVMITYVFAQMFLIKGILKVSKH